MFIDPESGYTIWQLTLEFEQSRFAEVTEAGVVVTTLGVVEVWDHDAVEVRDDRDVEALAPTWALIPTL